MGKLICIEKWVIDAVYSIITLKSAMNSFKMQKAHLSMSFLTVAGSRIELPTSGL